MQREVIKWIQSLDLSFTIHNPRRDLMNGFVVAEILSRYDKNISMHSFDTGSALAKRLDNWQQISKALQRLKCTNVTEELIALVVQGREGAGRRLLEEMYMFLTKKKLHVSPIDGTGTGAASGLPLSGAASTIQHAQELPAYMRPTAAKVLRDENDATKERYCQLTGKTDQLKLLAQSEQALESHAVALQAQKFQDPDRFKPKAHPPPESARTRSAKTSTSRTRQKLQAARQMAVRGIDDTILAAFAQRQEHEREEAFKAQFDPTDDLSSALSRVCVRPLQQSGLCEALDEYSAAEAGATPAPASSGSSVPPPTSGDYFTKFILHRNVVPPEAKALVWSALMGAANNIAKHANLRLEELYHLTNTLEFAISNHSKHASDAFGGDDSGDADRALDLLISVGQHWQRLDLDNPVTAACLVLIPSWAEAACNGARDAIQRFAALLHAFCNNRDVESVKKIINAFAANSTNVAKNASLTSALLEKIDARLCLGMEDVLEYYASSLLASPRASDRGAGLRLLKPLSWVSPRRVDAFLETMRSLMSDVDWEVRLILLQITAVLFEAASAPKPPALDSGSTTASPRGRSQSISAQDAAGGDSETSVNAAAPASVSIRETGHLLTAAFDCLEGFSPQVRRASLLAIAPYLNYDAQPALCDAFITRLYGLGSQHIRACLAHSEVPEGLPGRIAPAYQTSDVVSVWNSVAVACALINARPQLTTLDFLTVLEPLIHRADLNGANRSVWIAVGEQAKPDVVDSVYNPANLRGVTEQQLATCNRLATSVAVRLYTEMSGEDDGDLHDSQGDQDSESLARKLQERALDWMQSAL